jgi:hypothetical protein
MGDGPDNAIVGMIVPFSAPNLPIRGFFLHNNSRIDNSVKQTPTNEVLHCRKELEKEINSLDEERKEGKHLPGNPTCRRRQ